MQGAVGHNLDPERSWEKCVVEPCIGKHRCGSASDRSSRKSHLGRQRQDDSVHLRPAWSTDTKFWARTCLKRKKN